MYWALKFLNDDLEWERFQFFATPSEANFAKKNKQKTSSSPWQVEQLAENDPDYIALSESLLTEIVLTHRSGPIPLTPSNLDY